MRALLFGLLLVIAPPLHAAEPKDDTGQCPVPKNLTFLADQEIRRDKVGFTQGLELHDGAFYESTGNLFGDTRINRIDPRTGRVITLMNAGKSYFGEGMTFFGGKLYQMTWREHRVFVFDKDMKRLPELKNPREGWGLTHDESQLIASDGSSRIYFLSPQDFSVKRTIKVRDRQRAIDNLNELEFAQGAIWANIFTDWDVVKISPDTGCILARVDLRHLRSLMNFADRRALDADTNFVPNGIAFDAASGLFTVTGKNWPMLYSGRILDAN